ncbi:MAG: hypothetical protein ACR2P2_06175 [Nakamurella sp.]
MRPAQLETPRSYLNRLCTVNVIDRRVIDAAIRDRRRITGIAHQLALVICELGGPNPSRFVRSHLLATGTTIDAADTLLALAYRRGRGVRYACTHCTAGQIVETFDHRRFCICLKHRRWLAPGHGPEQQRPIPDGSQWVTAERRYRAAAATGFLTRRLIDATWQAVHDQATILGPPAWADRLHAAETRPGFVEGVDDRLALYPHTSRVLHLLAHPRTWATVDALVRGPEPLPAHLGRELAWIPDQKRVLVEALAAELIRTRRARLTDLDRLLGPYIHQQLRRHPPEEPI